MRKKHAIVLLSGGLDSCVALWWAKRRGYACHALSFDYGQRHKKELKNAARIAKKAGVSHFIIRVKLPWSKSSLTDMGKPLPHQSLKKILAHKIPSTYVPGRNTIFLSFALSLADQSEADAIVIGANVLDYSGYPDCRGPYLRAFEKVARLGSKTGSEKTRTLKILAPLLKLDKRGIIKLGLSLGAPMSLTWSCYQGGARPCGRCDSCLLREKGFHESFHQ